MKILKILIGTFVLIAMSSDLRSETNEFDVLILTIEKMSTQKLEVLYNEAKDEITKRPHRVLNESEFRIVEEQYARNPEQLKKDDEAIRRALERPAILAQQHNLTNTNSRQINSQEITEDFKRAQMIQRILLSSKQREDRKIAQRASAAPTAEEGKRIILQGMKESRERFEKYSEITRRIWNRVNSTSETNKAIAN